ncbi:MAG: beta-ketoacyl synthase chain length factor [Treponema sp.]|jgi:hypothetical protein|nr:beta-ketoacyl synthase chain length factor [Treponema sp.]
MNVYAARFAAWAPGFTGADDWKSWARDKRTIPQNAESPVLDYIDPLYRRRLSRISRMTIQVIHDVLPVGKDTKLVFVSFRGELGRQLAINRMLAEDGDIKPAAFSLSVFNTPPALAAIAFNLDAGYTAVYPGNDSFRTGLMAALAPVVSGAVREIVLVYADELCPEEYGAAAGGYAVSQGPPGTDSAACVQPRAPFAFAALLCRGNSGTPVVVSGEAAASPEAFLKYLLLAS